MGAVLRQSSNFLSSCFAWKLIIDYFWEHRDSNPGWEGKTLPLCCSAPLQSGSFFISLFPIGKKGSRWSWNIFFSDRSQFSQLPEKLTFQEKKFEFQIKTIVGHFQTRGKLNFMSVCQVWLSERFEKLKRTLEWHESTGNACHKYAIGMCHWHEELYQVTGKLRERVPGLKRVFSFKVCWFSSSWSLFFIQSALSQHFLPT